MKIKYFLIQLWNLLDPIYYFCSRLHCLEESATGNKQFLRVRLTRYRGYTVALSDGTVIHKNDLLIKIHLHNARLLKEALHIENEMKKTMYIYKSVKSSMPLLAMFLSEHPKRNEIKGIVGITTINKGHARLGFESFPITNRLYKWFKQITHYPIYLLSPTRTTVKSSRNPHYLFISKDIMLSEYSS